DNQDDEDGFDADLDEDNVGEDELTPTSADLLENDGDEGDDHGQEEDSSGAQIRRLATVLRKLVHSPSIRHKVNKNYVRKSLLKNMDATDREVAVVRDLVNLLRPFAPKRVPVQSGLRDPTGHVVLSSPMVIIAQATLDALGLHKFKRRISPSARVGSTIGLQVSPGVLYEMFGAMTRSFDIQTSSGTIIRAVSDAATPANKEAVVAAFFDLPRIQEECRAHNLHFDNRYVTIYEKLTLLFWHA
ncbi:hypothetical protein EC968_010446, partial [Mortierella alpina]